MKSNDDKNAKGNEGGLKIFIRSEASTNEEPKEFLALLFDKQKNLLERTKIKEDQAVFNTCPDSKEDFTLLVAPNRKEIRKESNFQILISRHKAYQPIIQINANNEYAILPIPELYLQLWYIRRCRVSGNVAKNFEISGLTSRKGLCNARVHICEVDKISWLLPRIPDDILVQIPDFLINPDLLHPIPVEPLPPIPTPPYIPQINLAENLRMDAFNSQKNSENRSVENLNRMQQLSQPLLKNASIMSSLQSRNPIAIRATIATHFQLFHPIFCWIPWLWPYFYKCDEIKTVYTDHNGDFDTEITYSLFGDHPDLYFWVEHYINGEWVTVYKPSLPCHVYWNYNCGSHVGITVTDPRVEWDCTEELSGKVIWVKSIGSGTSVSHIEQEDVVGAQIQGRTLKRQGLTDKFETAGNYRRPFGAGLSFKVQFSSAVYSDEYMYYRWSYRKLKHADLSPAYGSEKAIGNAAHKTYSFVYLDDDNIPHIDYNSVKLGPVDTDNEKGLYIIPSGSPTLPPFNKTEDDAGWQSRDTWTISFDSSLEGDGLYEFSLELFDSSGNKVQDIPNELFQVPNYHTFAPSVVAPSINLKNPGDGNCDAFKMVMRIDNSKCVAQISKLKVDGVYVNPRCCGFVPYTGLHDKNIEIKFKAYHPHNFADFRFRVKKGTCSDTTQTGLTNASGMVIGPDNGYARSSSSEYTKLFSAAELLGICAGEGKAAFAEDLDVYALATNGNQRLSGYDDTELVAFALEPAGS